MVGVAIGAGLFSTTALNAQTQLDAQDKRVVAKLESVLRERVESPDGKLKLVIVPTARASEGVFSSIHIEGAPAKLRKLRVTSFVLDAKNVKLDVAHLFRESKVRTISSATTLKAVISEDDLTQMLAQGRRTKEMGLKVKYEGDKMRVTGTLNFPLLNGPIEGIGQLRLAGGHKVNLDILSLKLRGVETPQFVKDQFESRINPVIDYQDLPFSPPFRGVQVKGNKATIHT